MHSWPGGAGPGRASLCVVHGGRGVRGPPDPCAVARATSGFRLWPIFALLPGFLFLRASVPSWPPGQRFLIRGGDPAKEQGRWEPQEPPAWPLGMFLMENSVAALSCVRLKEGTARAHQHLRKTLGLGVAATRTGRRQDTADQRQGEVRDPGPNPLSAISELWDFGKVSPPLSFSICKMGVRI